MRLLAICLDAAERSVMNRLIDEGALPNIARLRQRGLQAELDRQQAYRAESAHISLLTGQDPEQLGYWGPNLFDPETYEVSVRGTYLGAPFYADRNVRTVIFDVPQMALAAGVDGVQVAAWGAHSPQHPPSSYPPGLFDEITRRFGPHPAARSDTQVGWHNERFLRELGDALVEGARRRAKIVRWLMSEHPDWELFMTAWSETHSAGHQYFYGIDESHPLHSQPTAGLAAEQFRRCYVAVDEALGEVLDAIDDETTVMTFAAHGMDRNAGDVPALLLVPELLHRRHTGKPFIRFEKTDVGQGWVQLPPERHPFEHLRKHVDVSVAAAAASSPRERARVELVHRLPPRAVSAARQVKGLLKERSLPKVWWQVDERPFKERPIAPGNQQEDAVPAGSVARWYRPFWKEMRYFALPSFSDAHFRINVKGRESAGIVAPEDFRSACDELEALLRQIVDGRTGEPLVDEVVRPRGDDPMAMPGLDADLVVSFNAVTDRIMHPEVGTIGPAPYLRPGEHSGAAWVVIAGPGIKPDRLHGGQVDDLAPTILELLGQSTDGVNGRPLVTRPVLSND